ncbi:MAG: arginine--tRNA ligase [Nanoarchaeota archaeon]|nr:arginine--tRNA ligase [Nanoarchaeota archaeon]
MDPDNPFFNAVVELIATQTKMPSSVVEEQLEIPPPQTNADLAFPCYALAKQLRKSPNEIADNLAGTLKPAGIIKRFDAAGPYLNITANWSLFGDHLLKDIITKGNAFGSSSIGNEKTVLVDFSSPNIAKPMSVGHMRSTIIGDALARIYQHLGYKIIRDNHVGDWGTQFGKLLVAYEKWGSEEKVKNDPIPELLSLYVQFHDKAEKDPTLEDAAREAFRKLEEGDPKLVKTFEWFWKLSAESFKKTYDLLNISFDTWSGERRYVAAAKHLTQDALKQGIVKESKGAWIVPLDPLPPLIIQKSNESTIYASRDLAMLQERIKIPNIFSLLYVVGSEQKLYFQQLFAAAKKLNLLPDVIRATHVDFGLMSLPGGKMSTRKGRVVYLNDVIAEAARRAETIMKEKNPDLFTTDRGKDVAFHVGVGALKYADLSRDRIKNIVFSWDDLLSFEGDTGPYLQYTHARCTSILKKGGVTTPPSFRAAALTDTKEIAVLRSLAHFPHAIHRTVRENKPHIIAHAIFDLATAFNHFYQAVPVLQADAAVKAARIALVAATKTVLYTGLALLGIAAPEEM